MRRTLRTRRARALLGCASALLAVGAFAPAALQAQTGDFRAIVSLNGSLNQVQYSSQGNSVTVFKNGANNRFQSGGGLKAGDGCTQIDAATVDCPNGDVLLSGGPRNDSFFESAFAPITNKVTGKLGAGNDSFGGGITTAKKHRARAHRASLQDDNIEGGEGDDTLATGDGNDTISGGPGDDNIDAGKGNDAIDGGSGIDTVAVGGQAVSVNLTTGTGGAPGEAKTFAGVENITATGGGNATLVGDGAGNILTGGAGDDHLVGNGGPDLLFASEGNNTLEGGDGSDSLNAGSGDDNLQMGNGDDVGNAGGGNDLVNGGEGDDTLNGSDGIDNLQGDAGDDIINPGAGNDLVDGGGGTNGISLDGASGPTNINLATGVATSSDGTDSLTNIRNATGSGANDTMIGNNQDNVLAGGDGNDALDGADGNDTLSGGNGADIITGGNGTDGLLGGSGTDNLNGGPGNDFLEGNTDADVIAGGGGSDTVSYLDRVVNVVVDADGKPHSGQPGEGDTVATDVANIEGGAGDDVLFGNALANLLDGNGGNDIIISKEGVSLPAQVAATAPADRVVCGFGVDTVQADANDSVYSGPETADRCEFIDRGAAKLVTLSRGRLRVSRSGNVSVNAACAIFAQTACTGSLSVRSGSKLASSTRRIALPAGSAQRLTVHLSRSSLRKLRGHKTRSFTLRATATDGTGQSSTTSNKVKLRR